MISTPTATVFGAYGHTGRFIVTELRAHVAKRSASATFEPERRSCLLHSPEESGCLVSRKRSLAKRLPSM